MLTRIEIDGFKSFAGFELDVPPFLAILGQNASGKSNLFDAIQLIRRLATMDLFEALSQGRGEIGELFRIRGDGRSVDTMTFAVEVLVEPQMTDQFGRSFVVSHTRLRYEVQITQRPDNDGFTRPYVVYEDARSIQASRDRWSRERKPSQEFRKAHLRYGTGPTWWIETGTVDDKHPIFRLKPAHRGRPREIPAQAAEATVLSGVTSAAEFPALYALRKELESWRFLQLDPVALRRPSGRQQRGDHLDVSGANLAKVLRRIEQQGGSGSSDVLTDIAADLARVIRGLRGVRVVENPATEEWEIYLETRDEGEVSARIASDGTLRVLALLAALYDPAHGGLICFEEPENGIFPQRLRDLVSHLQDLVTDLACRDVGYPLAQLLVSSHSPLMLLAVNPKSTVVFDWVSRTEPGVGQSSRITRARYVRQADDAAPPPDRAGYYVSTAERRAAAGISASDASALLGA